MPIQIWHVHISTVWWYLFRQIAKYRLNTGENTQNNTNKNEKRWEGGMRTDIESKEKWVISWIRWGMKNISWWQIMSAYPSLFLYSSWETTVHEKRAMKKKNFRRMACKGVDRFLLRVLKKALQRKEKSSWIIIVEKCVINLSYFDNNNNNFIIVSKYSNIIS